MRLFCLIDETVIGCWSDTNHQPEDCGLTRDKVINLQRELDRALDTSQTALSKSSMATGDVSEIRKADLLVTQQWLKNRVWTLGCLPGRHRQRNAVFLPSVIHEKRRS
jgi:hypothetical protein